MPRFSFSAVPALPATQSAVDQIRSSPEVMRISITCGLTSVVHMTLLVLTRVAVRAGFAPSPYTSWAPWRLRTRSSVSQGAPGFLGLATDGDFVGLGLGVGDGVGGAIVSERRPASNGSAAATGVGLLDVWALEVLSGPSDPLEHAQATTATTTSTPISTLMRRRQ